MEDEPSLEFLYIEPDDEHVLENLPEMPETPGEPKVPEQETVGEKEEPVNSHDKELDPSDEENISLDDVCKSPEFYQHTMGTLDDLNPRVHFGQESVTSSSRFSCEICHKRFGVKALLTSHSLVHGSDGVFTCPKCGKVFRRVEHVVRHVKRLHPVNHSGN